MDPHRIARLEESLEQRDREVSQLRQDARDLRKDLESETKKREALSAANKSWQQTTTAANDHSSKTTNDLKEATSALSEMQKKFERARAISRELFDLFSEQNLFSPSVSPNTKLLTYAVTVHILWRHR